MHANCRYTAGAVKASCVAMLAAASLLTLAVRPVPADPVAAAGSEEGVAVVGGFPVPDVSDIAVNSADGRVYVASWSDPTISVFDGSTNTRIATIRGPGSSPVRLAVNSVTSRVYASDGWSDILTVFDGIANTVIARIPVPFYGGDGGGVAVNPITNRVYLGTHSTVTVIDGATNAIVATLPCPGLCTDIAADPATDRIYVGDWRSVFVIDGATDTIVATIPMSGYPNELDVDSATNRLYAADFGRGTLSVIDGATDSIVDTISVGPAPRGVSVDAAANRIYVATAVGVTVVDGATDEVVATVPACGPLGPAAYSGLSGHLYAANGYAFSVLIVGSGPADVTGPTVTTPSLALDPLPFGQSTIFSAAVADDLSGAFRGEYFVGPDPGAGLARPLAVMASTLSHAVGDALTPGVYPVGVRARDQACNWSATSTSFLVVYDPSAGFATGAGSIVPGSATSDAGDLLPGLDGSSKAQFAFVVKYQNGSQTVPDGNLEFQYRAGDLHLKSAEMDWLVVTNQNWAKFQGTATIAGTSGTYPLRVEARDGHTTGQPDRFAIKVYSPGADPDTTGPIYKASGDLIGGQVQIHR